MKYLKYFENNNIIIQQPFYLSDSDFLYLSDDLAKKLAPDFKGKKYNKGYINRELSNQIDFFNDSKNEKGQIKVRRITLDISVVWRNMYSMNLALYRGNDKDTKFGRFHYYLVGISGDSEMHGKSMILATRECNLNLIIKLYPIVKYIKNFYKTLKTKEKGFFQIIKDAILNDHKLIKHGVPTELLDDDDIGYLIHGEKYNL